MGLGRLVGHCQEEKGSTLFSEKGRNSPGSERSGGINMAEMREESYHPVPERDADISL